MIDASARNRMFPKCVIVFSPCSSFKLNPQDRRQRPFVVEWSPRCVLGSFRDLAEILLKPRRSVDHEALGGLGLGVPPAEEDASRDEDQCPCRGDDFTILKLEGER